MRGKCLPRIIQCRDRNKRKEQPALELVSVGVPMFARPAVRPRASDATRPAPVTSALAQQRNSATAGLTPGLRSENLA